MRVSKRAHATCLSRDYGVEMALEKFYRMMDRLDERRIQRLQERIDEYVRGLLGGAADIVFVDVTTLSFASEVSDNLRKKGWSKDGKPQRVQVVLALVQTREGLPVGYQLFPGNTADVSTLQPMVEQLRERYTVGRMVVVTDAGMASALNLKTLSEAGFDWVVAARLRSLSEAELEPVFSSRGWKFFGEADSRGRTCKILDCKVKGRRLVVRYSPEKARKDAHEREHALEQLQKNLPQGLRGSGRRQRYLKIQKGAVCIDATAVQRDACFDGLHGIWTSLTDCPAEQVRKHYAQLWQIEEGFRVLKHTLSVRPIFHWTERRVRAHVAICYVAFALLRILRWKYRRQHAGYPALSEAQILNELSHVEASLVRDSNTGNRYLIPSCSSKEQRMLYSTVGRKLPGQTVLVPEPRSSKARR